MRELFARWASPRIVPSGVTGVHGGTAHAEGAKTADFAHRMPVTPDLPAGVPGVTAATGPGRLLHHGTPAEPEGVTGPDAENAPDARRVGADVTRRTPVTPLDDDLIEAFEERAAIVEFDGGLPRTTAEAEAARSLGIRPLHR